MKNKILLHIIFSKKFTQIFFSHKKFLTKTLLLFFTTAFILFAAKRSEAQTNTFPSTGAAGIGTTTPNASSLLEIKSTTKGILISRMTKTQRDAIISPAEGLMIYQTNSTPGFYYYNGSAWVAVSPKGVNKSLSNLTAPTALNVDLLPGNDNILNLGSANNSWKNVYADGSIYLGGSRFIAYATGTGTGNTALGSAALNANSTGINNTAIGYNTLFSNISGGYNTANGYQSLYSNNTGSFNTANGYFALYFNTTGGLNTANGYQSLYSNANGNSNTATGYTTLRNNTNGNYNTANGYGALYSNTSGSYNVANGYSALYYNSTGNSNVAVGKSALYYNVYGSNLVAVGDSALYNIRGEYGEGNTAIGSKAMFANTIGFRNTAIGTESLAAGSVPYNNTAIGYRALYNNANSSNVAVGDETLYSDVNGQGNTAIGSGALYENTGGLVGFGGCYGCLNTAIGISALSKSTTGTYNTSVGSSAGANVISGSNNTFIGCYADCGVSGSLDNSTVIGFGALTTTSNHFVFGNADVTGWGFGVESGSRAIKVGSTSSNGNGAYLTAGGAWTNTSARAKKEDFQKQDKQIILEKINQLEITKWKYKGTKDEYHYGPMADDFHRLFGVANDSSIADMDKTGVLFLGMQALSKANDSLKSEVTRLVSTNDELKSQINTLNDKLSSVINKMAQVEASMSQCCNSFSSPINSSNNNSSINKNSDKPKLEQNVPNPFDGSCYISYYIPSGIHTAQLRINDISGRTLKTYSLATTGYGKQTIYGSELSSGMYQYSLLIDGKLIDTKKMVLAK